MQLYIVLVAPTRPENIGAAARAMKTMGFTALRIVASEAHQPSARWVAHGAGEILDGVQTFATLEQALADVDFTVATPPVAGRASTTIARRRSCSSN